MNHLVERAGRFVSHAGDFLAHRQVDEGRVGPAERDFELGRPAVRHLREVVRIGASDRHPQAAARRSFQETGSRAKRRVSGTPGCMCLASARWNVRNGQVVR